MVAAQQGNESGNGRMHGAAVADNYRKQQTSNQSHPEYINSDLS
jgi:hypothetical protein